MKQLPLIFSLGLVALVFHLTHDLAERTAANIERFEITSSR